MVYGFHLFSIAKVSIMLMDSDGFNFDVQCV